ncbi:hypothetical protein VdG1_03362 [Verticillium dahliae VDG1]|nr:hypothetical protein VdG1_03362 [Verticillium dahliae VDG1]
MPSTRSEDWKSNPPYARPQDEPFTNTLRGSCHCGQVVYHLSRDRPLASNRIMDEGRNMVLLFPALVEFEGDEEVKANFAPEMHIFYTRRVVDITDGKPKWAGLNDKSELVGETR